MDKPVNHRHLWIAYSSMAFSDKTFMGMSTSGPNGEGVMAMVDILAGADYIWRSAGWNEAGLHCSMAKFVVDAEQCAMAYRMTEGPR